MYQIGICDDEPAFTRHLAGLIEEIMSSHRISYEIHIFSDLPGLQRHLEHSGLDLLLLDILLKKDNGIDYAARLRKDGNDIPIIFITCSMDYVLDGYTVEPVGYLVKPIDPDRLTEALLRAFQRHSRGQLVIHSPARTLRLRLDEILYLEIMNKKLSIHMADGSVPEAFLSLSSFCQKLPAGQFAQCHRSYVVALPAIRSIRRYKIELKDHSVIPISKKYYREVQNALLSWAAASE